MSAFWTARPKTLQHCITKHICEIFRHRDIGLRLHRLYVTSPGGVLSLCDRGILQTVFPEGSVDELSHHLKKSRTLYCGFDPTSDSLHIGNLVGLIGLLHCQRAGHTPLVLIGGATALIGDPSGKTTERQPMSKDEVESNVISITENVERIVSNFNKHIQKASERQMPPLKILSNTEWYQGVKLIDFLSTVGRHFRMGPMLAKHSVQSRMSSPEGMSFTEFTYQIFQAYDWLHLHDKYQCTIQIGGNDQLGNIVAGYELISSIHKQSVYGLTVPLVTTSAGDKLGKTAGNAIWLNPTKTTPFQLYQYFINMADADVEKYLKIFTFLPDKEIDSIMQEQNMSPENRVAQRKLAEQVTLLVHGDVGLEASLVLTKLLYGGSLDDIAHTKVERLSHLLGQAPVQMSMDPSMTLLDVCMKARCFGRIEDAERIIKAGGVYVNNHRIQQTEFSIVPEEHILPNNTTLIRIGKKTYHIIHWNT